MHLNLRNADLLNLEFPNIIPIGLRYIAERAQKILANRNAKETAIAAKIVNRLLEESGIEFVKQNITDEGPEEFIISPVIVLRANQECSVSITLSGPRQLSWSV